MFGHLLKKYSNSTVFANDDDFSFGDTLGILEKKTLLSSPQNGETYDLTVTCPERSHFDPYSTNLGVILENVESNTFVVHSKTKSLLLSGQLGSYPHLLCDQTPWCPTKNQMIEISRGKTFWMWKRKEISPYASSTITANWLTPSNCCESCFPTFRMFSNPLSATWTIFESMTVKRSHRGLITPWLTRYLAQKM